jgi:rhodanese-related sulfurtransferase
MRRRSIGVLTALVFVTAGCGASAAVAEGVVLVAPDHAAEVLDGTGVVALDVRTPEEFAGGHLGGAVNVDFYAADFAERLAGLDRDTTYVLYCRSGNRSATTATMMRDLGFTSVVEVDGGILAWQEAGLPVER